MLLALGLKDVGNVEDPLKLVPAVAHAGGTPYLIAHVAFRRGNIHTLTRPPVVERGLRVALVPLGVDAGARLLAISRRSSSCSSLREAALRRAAGSDAHPGRSQERVD